MTEDSDASGTSGVAGPGDPARRSERVADAAARLGELARVDEPIGPMTTYRVGGSAALFVAIENEADLARVAATVRATGVATLVIGKGSNLLVADTGFDGLALALGDGFATVVIDGVIVRAGAAASLPVVARRTAAAGLTGFEWAVGVPGTIGGAVRMNAGGHGSDMAATVVRVRVVDLVTGEDREMESAALSLGYRCSSIAPHHLVVGADLKLRAGDRSVAETEISEIVRWRREHQPGGPNAGSVFTNPPGDSAGRLIDLAGLKGFRWGSAEVSTKHANFIQADVNGRADDVWKLMVEVRRQVQVVHGVVLEPETRLIGFPPVTEARAS